MNEHMMWPIFWLIEQVYTLDFPRIRITEIAEWLLWKFDDVEE